MVTIKQVALEAGVSKSTVSRLIAQNGYVSDASRKKIEQAIQKLHFVPNLSAQSLKTKKNKLVGLLLPDISNPFFSMLAKGAETFLKEKDYRLILGNIGENCQFEKDYVKVLIQSNAVGIISTHDFKEEFPDLNLPSVVVDRVEHGSDYGVFSDNVSGGQLAAEVIINSGGKKVAVISGPSKTTNINDRFTSCVNFLKEKGITFKTFYSKSYDFEQIQKEAKKVLAYRKNFDSIIAPSDIHAIAYIHEIHRLGKRIPEDIQIIGYDDIQLGQFSYPALSTIHQSAYQMGFEAAQLVYKIATNQTIETPKIELPIRYIERQTVRKK